MRMGETSTPPEGDLGREAILGVVKAECCWNPCAASGTPVGTAVTGCARSCSAGWWLCGGEAARMLAELSTRCVGDTGERPTGAGEWFVATTYGRRAAPPCICTCRPRLRRWSNCSAPCAAVALGERAGLCTRSTGVDISCPGAADHAGSSPAAGAPQLMDPLGGFADATGNEVEPGVEVAKVGTMLFGGGGGGTAFVESSSRLAWCCGADCDTIESSAGTAAPGGVIVAPREAPRLLRDFCRLSGQNSCGASTGQIFASVSQAWSRASTTDMRRLGSSCIKRKMKSKAVYEHTLLFWENKAM
mmetsp:Transcript_45546/g.105601  ORF Transcript_45546/g.105601 Transcript_45546/m.105601 type:complete len:303 (-) Transcript_45546:171-1079(-)